MASIRVADATDPASIERAAFHAVPDAVYQGEPPGTAPRRESVERNLARPEFAERQCVLVAAEGAGAIARVVARVSPALRADDGSPIGLLSFFEAQNRGPVVTGLLHEATRWLRERGVRQVVGPMDGDTWHRYRVNVGPFERAPFPLEPWNPAYYQALWEGAGFSTLECYSSKWIDDVTVLLPGLAAGVQRSEARGVRIRGLRRDRMTDELSLVHALSSQIFDEAFLYSPISRDEFLDLYSGLAGVLDPRLVLFAESADGTPVGFVFAYADPERPAVHYKTIGVLAEWRRAAVAAALSHHVYTNALAQGRPEGNHALMRDDNRSQALDQGLGDVFRRYVLYGAPAA